MNLKYESHHMIPFPNIHPVIVSIGPISIYWYSLAYVFGIMFGWWRASALSLKFNLGISKKQLEDFITYAIIGIIMGGRLGYVLLYDPVKYLSDPLEIFKTYEGGMSFHGGFIGLIVAGVIYCRKYRIEFLRFMDLMTMVAPVGIFFGRIANFINAELYGRVTDVAWAVVFPGSDGAPRHPSQLYEALLEGLVLFFIMHLSQKALLIKGRASGIFFIFYALFRIFVECFREPDVQLGFLFGGCTMGQLLCLPMVIFGILLLYKNDKKN